MVGEQDRGRTDPCAKHIDGQTDPGRTDGCEHVEGENGPFTLVETKFRGVDIYDIYIGAIIIPKVGPEPYTLYLWTF